MPYGSYSTAPLVAWAGWRMRIAGGPRGGMYHGYLADNAYGFANIPDPGWPAGDSEIFRPMDNPQNLGIYPWHGWDTDWVGSPLMEGQTVSDFVYRGPAEMRPRPNASGGINTIRAAQYPRTPGYSIAPGNYRTLGGIGAMPGGGSMRICPAWGCGPPHVTTWDNVPTDYVPSPVSPSPAPVVAQPPPPTSPAPAPTVPMGPAGSSGCAAGQFRDASGNCTSDWRNPYPISLPIDSPLSPAPTVSANTCPTGYSMDSTGNCLAPGVCPSGFYTDPTSGNCVSAAPTSGLMAWLEETTSFAGLNIPNAVLAGGFALAALHFMSGSKGRK